MKLAAIGSNCIDFYRNLQGGLPCPGGGPVNMAVYTLRLGGTASYIGPVGEDPYGALMQKAIAEKGVDVSHLHMLPGATAVSQVELRDGERVFGDYDEGVLAQYALSPEDVDFICTHDVVVCDLWGKVEPFFPEFQARGLPTAFDGAVRPDDPAGRRALPYTDYFFFSSESGDAPALRERLRRYHAQGPKLVTAMLGEQGSLCFDGKEFHKFGIIPCPKVVDSMGAGDSYIAGFLTGILADAPIEKAMEMGAAAATETLQYFGAW